MHKPSRRVWAILLALGLLALFLFVVPAPAAPITITVPYSSVAVNATDLDGNPATGAWSDAGNWTIPLENGASAPYGSARLVAKHDASYIYFRIDGSSDIPWQSATATHFWLGMQISPSGTTHHSSGTWEGAFFGLWDGQSYTPMPTYPPAVVETTDFNKPPTQNATNRDLGFMGVKGSAAPYSFTAEWRRPLNAGGLFLVADGSTSYHFFVTTETNSAGANGGNINHGQITNVNVMRLASSSGGGTVAPPSVAITSPAANAVLSGVVAVAASASSSVGIAHVDFSVGTTSLGSVTAPPYSVSWDTTGYANGPFTIAAKAYDTQGTAASASISVSVDHSIASVSILSPANNSVVRGTVPINASATAPAGVNQVDFFVDGSPLASSTEAPYSAVWDSKTASEGAHGIRAMASFGGGGALNATVTVYVDRTPPLRAPAVSAGGVGTLIVTWDPSPGRVVAGYLVFRASSPNGPFVQLNANPVRNTTFLDSGLVPGATYYYEIVPVDVWGFAASPSPPAGGVAGAPSLFDWQGLRWAVLPAGMGFVLILLALLVRRELRRRGQALQPPQSSPPDNEGGPDR